MGMGNLARMAQQMQADMARTEEELRSLRLEGTAGGGAVTAVVTGRQELVSVTIDPAVVDPEDVEMLQDLVTAAVNDGLRSAREEAEQRMARVTGGLRIPGLG
ncbi:MAG: YbaB/EbfC family nucleoid-associated protein [Candidatus Limnocylindrales bacterium]